MDFNKYYNGIAALYLVGMLTGCSGPITADLKDEYAIGNKPTVVSSLSVPNGDEPQSVVIFDKTVRRIHQFDVRNMRHVRSLEVRNAADEHFVLYDQPGNYVVDLSAKGLSIFNKNGQANHQPIRFQGKPKSAAFDPANGNLIVYDDLMSVGMVKLSGSGEVLMAGVFGPVISGKTIASGDLSASGKLILAMSDASIVVVDVAQTLSLQGWVFTQYATGLTDIRWVAPLPKMPSQILVRTASKIALLDVNTQSTLGSYDVSEKVVKLSKFNDPHVLLRDGNKLIIVYADNSTLKSKTLYLTTGVWDVHSILSSNLDLAKNTWSMVDTQKIVSSIFNDLDESRVERSFKRYRFNDLLAYDNKVVPGDTQIEVGQNFIFALWPSQLGLAVRYDIDSNQTLRAEAFNKSYIPAN